MARVAHGISIFFVSACSIICLQAVYKLQVLYASTLGDITPFFMLLTFILHFVIDFLSI